MQKLYSSHFFSSSVLIVLLLSWGGVHPARGLCKAWKIIWSGPAKATAAGTRKSVSLQQLTFRLVRLYGPRRML